MENLISHKPGYISIPNPSKVSSLLSHLSRDGSNNLHVIIDFDMTLTKHFIAPSERNLSSHGVLERGAKVSVEFARKTRELVDLYYPFEIAHIPIVEKTKLMVEWWTKAHELMVLEGITKSYITSQAISSNMQFREGIQEFIDICEEGHIPLMIFSAGIKNVIEALLSVNDLTRSNQLIIGNEMLFEGDVCIGFKEPLIHVLNKGQHAIHNQLPPALRSELERRRNVLVIGDSLGDAHMADGIQVDNILKIGLFNFGDEQRKREFEREFDVLITGDNSLNWVTEVLATIRAEHNSISDHSKQ